MNTYDNQIFIQKIHNQNIRRRSFYFKKKM